MPTPADDPATRRLAQLAARKAQLEAQMTKVRARLDSRSRRELTAAKIVIGGAVLAHAKIDPSFAHRLATVLRAYVTRPADLRRIQSILASLDAQRPET